MSNRVFGLLTVCGIGVLILLAILLPAFLASVRDDAKEQSAAFDRVEPEVQALLKSLEAERESQKKLLDKLDDTIAKVRAVKQSVLAAAIRLNSKVELTDEEFRKRMKELADKIEQMSTEKAGMDGK
jgi:septal ring factor EnvC (AmiA/AmiB activator)